MDQERARIQADLQGLLEGDIRCDSLFTRMYASDASVYEIRPLGVVRPRHTGDVVACVKYANTHSIPIIARGAGTGVAGESVGAGLVLDFSCYMRRPQEINEETVRVQPGLVLARLNRHLAKINRIFGPDPATRSVTTMGSVLALDASGSHWMQYGTARDKVISMEVVLGNGTVIRADKQNLVAFGESNPAIDLARRVQHIVGRNRPQIESHRPKTAVSRCGYHLHDIIQDGQLDLARMFVGSEGTLALITEATLKTDPIPAHRGVMLLFFDRLEKAVSAAGEIAKMGAAACDLMDRRLLSIARENDRRYRDMIPVQAEAMLLVEYVADSVNEIRDSLQATTTRIQRKKKLAFDVRSTTEVDERNFYWRLARRVIPRLYRMQGNDRALPFVEDVVIPPANLASFLSVAQKIWQRHRVTASLFAHAAHGQVHWRPFLNLADRDDHQKMHRLAEELYEAVVEADGIVGGEHGDGLSRTWFLRRQFGDLYPTFRDIKRVCDPNGVLNPGKVVADNPQPLTKNFRSVRLKVDDTIADSDESAETTDADIADESEEVIDAPKKADALPVLNLNWSHEDVMLESRNCNGCGRCRSTSSSERMCPIFRLAPLEEASPRSKANLMRLVLAGEISAEEFATDEFKSIADLCVNCHQCRLECPAGVDIPKLMVEAKSQHVAANGLKPSESLMARVDGLCRLASRFDTLANWVIGNRTCRWFLEKVTGIAQARKLPRVGSRSFLKTAAKMRLTKPTRHTGQKVVYFVDSYANWLDTQLASALVKVLQHNGVEVYVHPAQEQSAMSLISVGAVDRARKIAQRNVSLLADAIRQGYHVIASEPAAALCLRHEYLNLLDDDDAKLVAASTSEACEYLWKQHELGQLELDFRPLNATVGYHLPCHQRALQIGAPGERLLGLIPGVTVERIDKGCSGMAGTFGLSKKNFRQSLRVGRKLINAVRQPRITAGSTECSTCKMQMEQGTSKGTLHPIKLLAYAYGLMPDVEKLLQEKNEDLFLS